MSDFFLSDSSDGGMNSSDLRVEARCIVRSQITVNRLFSVPQMARTINSTAETMNPAGGAQSDGSASSTSAGGTSSPSGSVASYIPLSLKPMTTDSQVKVRTKEEAEVVEGMDESTSTEREPSVESNGGFETASDCELKITPQASEQEKTDIGSSLTKLPTEEAPEKEEKEEEKALPVSPWLLEEEEPVDPLLVPDEQEAAPLPPEKKSSVPPLLPENELPEERELSLIWLPLDLEPSVIRFQPPKEQEVPQSSQETEPSVPQPESEQNVPQLPVEMKPSTSHPLLKKESPVSRPQLLKEPSLEKISVHSLRLLQEPIAPRAITPVSHPQVFKEPSLEEIAIPSLRLLQEPVTPRATQESLAQQSSPEKSGAFNKHPALQETSPYRLEKPAFREEKEPKIQSEMKAQPKREETATSALASPKLKTAAAAPARKGPTLGDTVEDITSHLKEVSSASKSAMVNSISSFVASPLGKVFANTIDRALEKSEEWLDYYLPVPETDVESSTTVEEEPGTPSEELGKEGCFVRISSLSTKLRNRAFQMALNQLKTTRETARDTLPVVDQLLDVFERHRGQNLLTITSIPEALQHLWAQRGPKQEPPKSPRISRMPAKEAPSIVPEQLELKALDLTRTLAQQLYSTYHDLLPHVANLPDHLQEKVIGIHKNMEELHAHFTSSPSLQSLPSSLFTQSRQRMSQARENLDEILDFMARNPAASWLSQPTSSPRGQQYPSATAQRQLRGRSPEGKASEEGSTSRQPPSLPHR